MMQSPVQQGEAFAPQSNTSDSAPERAGTWYPERVKPASDVLAFSMLLVSMKQP